MLVDQAAVTAAINNFTAWWREQIERIRATAQAAIDQIIDFMRPIVDHYSALLNP